MRIGLAGPISLRLLSHLVEGGEELNDGYSFPFTAHLALELHRRGNDVVVFALDPELLMPRSFRGASMTIRVAPYRRRHRARDLFASERRHIARAMSEEGCGVLHALWTYEFALAALSIDRSSLVTFQDWAPTILRLMPDPYRFMRMLMSTAVLVRGRNFSAISPYLGAHVERWRNGGVSIIPNGVPNPVVGKKRRPPIPEATVIGSVNSGFGVRKNVTALMRAFSLIRSRRPNTVLRLVGDGYEPGGPAQEWALANDLSEEISFEGRFSPAELDSYYDSIDLLVHPSLEESFGVVLIEAMSRGVPVIGGEHSGAVPWVLGEGKSGTLVDVTAPEMIADATVALLQNAQLWVRMSEEGIRAVQERFDISVVAEMYEREYQRIATG